MLRRNEIETAYAALFKPNSNKFSNPHSQEHCSANGHEIRMMGLNTGQQVRIERPTENGTTLALYTIFGAHDEEPNSIFVDYKDPENVEKRFGLSGTGSFQGKINAQVAAVGLTDAQAKAYSEFIEHLSDDGHNSELVVIAPHGGDIEEHTEMSRRNMLPNSFHLRVFLYGCAKVLRKEVAPLLVGTLLRQILARNHFRSLKRLLGVTLNMLLPSMDGTAKRNPFALEDQYRII
jgi:hypothetical protein